MFWTQIPFCRFSSVLAMKETGVTSAASCSVSIDFRPGGPGFCPGKDGEILQGEKFNSLSQQLVPMCLWWKYFHYIKLNSLFQFVTVVIWPNLELMHHGAWGIGTLSHTPANYREIHYWKSIFSYSNLQSSIPKLRSRWKLSLDSYKRTSWLVLALSGGRFVI